MKHANFFSWILPSTLLLALLFLAPGIAPKTMSFHYQGVLELPYQKSASLEGMAPVYEEKARFLSEIYETEDSFQLLALEWEQALDTETQASLQIRVLLEEGGKWSDWRSASPAEDAPSFVESSASSFYFLTPDAQAFQYRFDMSTSDVHISPRLKNVRFEAVNGGELPLRKRLARLVFDSSMEYQTRKDWGANEKLRMTSEDPNMDEGSETSESLYPDQEIAKIVKSDEMGNFYRWPLEYPKNGVQKIVIHHTASEDIAAEADFSKTVRAIYNYHTVTKGWGDIGYNFLVAPDGTIYEGRAGGDGVVAGHASGFNVGSLGIALIGNYEEEVVPAPMFKALSRLVLDKAKLHKINVAGSGQFRGKERPNLLGHRDVSATLCPGGEAYNLLPDLRTMVSQVVAEDSKKIKKNSFAFSDDKDREMEILQAGESKKISLSLKNTGELTWEKGTCFQMESKKDKGLRFEGTCHLKLKESSVKPGASGTFEGTIIAGFESGLALYQGGIVFGKNFSAEKASVAFYIESPELKFEITKQSKAYVFKPSEKKEIVLEIKNTSNFDWPKEEAFVLKASENTKKWTGDIALNQALKKGEKMTIKITLKAPEKLGGSVLQWTLQNSKATLKAEKKLSVVVKVEKGDVEEDGDALLFQSQDEIILEPKEEKRVSFQVKNVSGASIKSLEWGIQSPTGFKVGTPKMVLKNWPHNMSTKWTFSVKAPEKEGEYRLEFRPRLNQKNLTLDPFIVTVTVKKKTALSEDWSIPIRLTFDEPLLATSFSSTGKLSLQSENLAKSLTLAKGEKATVSLSDEKLVLSHNGKSYTLTKPLRVVAEKKSESITLENAERRPAWNLKLNDNEFFGDVAFYPENEELLVVNTLPLEYYLTGLGEISNHTEPEKIKTMVILARSYGLYYILHPEEKFPNQPYVLDDTPERSQKYLGASLSKRAPKIQEAVEATANMVVTYEGEVVKTPYFTQTDGTKTRSAKEVWGWTHTPYLVSVSDSYCTGTTKFLGHGVGLSGCGADGMAKAGFSFEEIIRYFYTGVDVEVYPKSS